MTQPSPPHPQITDFLVSRNSLDQTRIHVRPALPQLKRNQVLARVDSFAFTANNFTLALGGGVLGYWNIFPAETGWGLIPTWGFATVIESNHSDVAEGTQVYGYVPMSTHTVLQPSKVSQAGFTDRTPLRGAMAPMYNRYVATKHEPGFADEYRAVWALCEPLFTTAFLLSEELSDRDSYGASSIVISSASSKTAMCLAFLLKQCGKSPAQIVGLTSASKVEALEGLGCYHRVLSYGDIATMAPNQTVVFVDISGAEAVRGRVHRHFAQQVVRSVLLGASHWRTWQGLEADPRLPGATPEFFFAPAVREDRIKEWTATGLDARLRPLWMQFARWTQPWLEVAESAGPAQIEAAYRDCLAGGFSPLSGHMMSMWPGRS